MLQIPDRPNAFVAVLADGMGGQKHGALAAQAVIETARQMLAAAADEDPRRFLSGLCHRADAEIRRIGRAQGSSPASTCVALLVRGYEAYWVNVGDSRLYHFEAGRLLSRTTDHTVAEALHRQDDDSASPADTQPDRRLTMCLGGQNVLEPAFGVSAVGPKDWFVLCSDGLWNQAEPEQLAREAVNTNVTPTATELARQAVDRAGPASDNVCVLIARPAAARQKGLWRRLFSGGD